MGCRILIGVEQGTERTLACLYDSVTGFAFGPTFDSEEEAEAFIKWCEPIGDPRDIQPRALEREHVQFSMALERLRTDVFTRTAAIDSDDGDTVVAEITHGADRTVLHGKVIGDAVLAEIIVACSGEQCVEVESDIFDDGRSPPMPDVYEKASQILTALHKEVLECKPN